MTRLTVEVMGKHYRAIEVRDSEIWNAGFADAGYGDDGTGTYHDYEGYVAHVVGHEVGEVDVVDSWILPAQRDEVLVLAYGDPVEVAA